MSNAAVGVVGVVLLAGALILLLWLVTAFFALCKNVRRGADALERLEQRRR